MKNEIWKTVTNYSNYEVSSYGRIRNIKTKCILKPELTYRGYLRVVLYSNNVGKKFLVHRIVA